MNQDGDTYTATEVAEVLGVGKRRVLQILERGELPGYKDDLGRWHVPVPPVDAMLLERQQQDRRKRTKDASEEDTPPTNPEVGREFIDNLKDQVQHLRDQLATEQAANRENCRIIAGLIERIPELEPARDASGSPELPSDEPPKGTRPRSHNRSRSDARGGCAFLAASTCRTSSALPGRTTRLHIYTGM